MAFKFRFPIALLSYLKEDSSDMGFQNVIEKAREWALPIDGEKKKPFLKDAEDYVNEIVKLDQEEKARKDDRSV